MLIFWLVMGFWKRIEFKLIFNWLFGILDCLNLLVILVWILFVFFLLFCWNWDLNVFGVVFLLFFIKKLVICVFGFFFCWFLIWWWWLWFFFFGFLWWWLLWFVCFVMGIRVFLVLGCEWLWVWFRLGLVRCVSVWWFNKWKKIYICIYNFNFI